MSRSPRASSQLLPALLLVVAACGSKGSKKPATEPTPCHAACEHLIELALADVEKSASMMGAGGDQMLARVKERAAQTHDSDLTTCVGQCEAGKLDPPCVLQARTIDGAMTCHDASGHAARAGRQPIEPPSMRSDDDWPHATLHEVTGEAGGMKFTLRVPTELKEMYGDDDPDSQGWDFPGYPFSQPRFEVSAVTEVPPTEAAGLEQYGREPMEVFRKEHRPDRFVLAFHHATYVSAYVVIRAGDRALACRGTHNGSQLTNPAVIGPWLADVCATLAYVP